MQRNNVKSQFNVNAEKLVSFSELRQRTNKAYKENMTLSERVRLNLIDKPLGALMGVKAFVQSLQTGNTGEASSEDQEKAQQLVSGYYKDSLTNQMYLKGSSYNIMLEKSLQAHANNAFQEKITRLAVQAYDECKDYSQDKDLQKRLKPLMP